MKKTSHILAAGLVALFIGYLLMSQLSQAIAPAVADRPLKVSTPAPTPKYADLNIDTVSLAPIGPRPAPSEVNVIRPTYTGWMATYAELERQIGLNGVTMVLAFFIGINVAAFIVYYGKYKTWRLQKAAGTIARQVVEDRPPASA